jgi:Bacterial protein of unknown function (DUF899)
MFGPNYEAGCVTCSSTADSFNGVLPHLEARDVTMICISHAPLEKLLAYRRRMGWSFNWASSHESDFNFDFGVSVADEAAHSAPPLLEANEVAAFPRLTEPGVRENMPPMVAENAAATGTDVVGYFREGHGVSTFARDGNSVYHCYSSYARGTEFLMATTRSSTGRRRAATRATAGCGCGDTTSTTACDRRDTTVTGGLNVSKAARYRTLLRNPRAAPAVDDLTVWSRGRDRRRPDAPHRDDREAPHRLRWLPGPFSARSSGLSRGSTAT